MKRLAELRAIAFLIALTLGFYWRWFGPGTITDQDWWSYSERGLLALWPWRGGFNLQTGIGLDWAFALNYFPIEAAFGGLGHLGLSAAIAQRIVVMFPTILLLPIGMYFLARQFFSIPAAVVGALFYSSNAYINVIVARGQMTVAESYAAIPLACGFAVISVRSRSWRAAALCGASWSFAFACDVRIALLGLAPLSVVVIAELWNARNLARQWPLVAVWVACTGSLLAYVWFPLRALQRNVSPPLDYGDASWVSRLSSAGPLDLLTAYKPYWYDNALHGGQVWFWLFTACLILGAVALVRARPALGVPTLILFAISAVAASGTNTWFATVYLWLFDHTWIFKLFRDPSKFYAPAMWSFALFYSMAVAFLIEKFAQRRELIVAAAAILAIGPMLPELIGTQKQLFVPKTESVGEARLIHELNADRTPGRVLWIPVPDRMVPGDYLHPALGVDALLHLESGRTPVVNDATAVREAVHELGIRYIVIRRDGSEGLDWRPWADAFRELNTSAALGSLGRPNWDVAGLKVFRYDERIAAHMGHNMLVWKSDELTDLAVTSPKNNTSGLGANFVSAFASYPPGFLPDNHQLTGPMPASGHVTVLGTLRGNALQFTPSMSVSATIPDWTAYLIVDARCPASGLAQVSASDAFGSRRVAAVRCGTTARLLLRTDGLAKNVQIVSAGVIEHIEALDTAYAGLDPKLAGPGHRATLLLPLNARIRPVQFSKEVPLSTYEPSPVRIRFTAPATGLVTLPFLATPYWMASQSDATPRQAGLPTGLLQVSLHSGAVDVSYETDPYLRLGAFASLVALLAWALAIALPLVRRISPIRPKTSSDARS